MFSWRSAITGCRQIMMIGLAVLLAAGCGDDESTDSQTKSVPHQGQWGIYALDLATQDISLLYSSNDEISDINLSSSGDLIAFAMKSQDGVAIDSTSEIYTFDIDGDSLTRLTDNFYFDAYPSFSPDDSGVVFLSMRDTTLDLYAMKASGEDQHLLYNSGGHDADVDWGSGGRIAFTRDHQIWTVNESGGDPQQTTDPPDAGVWGNADVPVGDYDPRFSPDGGIIAFERMVDVSFVHGGYDIMVVSVGGGGETNLTNSGDQGYARGFPKWSHSGDRLIYILAAVGTEGRYDLYMMNSDGSDNHNITPDYFPATFLCRNAVFSGDDSKVYLIGQWWQ